jgi:hypothetical protein
MDRHAVKAVQQDAKHECAGHIPDGDVQRLSGPGPQVRDDAEVGRKKRYLDQPQTQDVPVTRQPV